MGPSLSVASATSVASVGAGASSSLLESNPASVNGTALGAEAEAPAPLGNDTWTD